MMNTHTKTAIVAVIILVMTIGGYTLEFDLSGDGVNPSNILVTIADSTDATASLNLTAAINNNATLAAIVTASRGIT